jgi:hypothetical protein
LENHHSKILLFRLRVQGGFVAASLILCLNSCGVAVRTDIQRETRLRETASLIDEVKAFGKTLGIEPTGALSRTTAGDRALSMLWLWLQKAGTLAVTAAIDIRMAVGFTAAKEELPLEQVYRVDGYSVYYRQGNEYADSRSAATPGFAAQGIVRRVSVILHEDLHGDDNFNLPWDIEEAVVTPLASLAAVEFFKAKGDAGNLQRARAALHEGIQVSRELRALVREAESHFRNAPVEEAKQKILDALSKYPAYQSMFERQVAGQHPPTVLEAKLSHDLAYFRFFDSIVRLADERLALKALIAEMKTLPRQATPELAEKFMRSLEAKYPRRETSSTAIHPRDGSFAPF